MSDQAVIPAPGYYPDPSVPGFVRYWNGGAWVPGTSRPAPAPGEVLEVPRFAVRPNLRPSARYIPPPVVPQPAQPAETGPVFLDQTSAGTRFTMGPEAAAESGWRADAAAQRGLMETGGAPRWVSWGAVEPAPELPAAGPPPAALPPAAPAPAVPEKSAEPTSPAALPARRAAVPPQKSAQPTSPAAAPRTPRKRAPAPVRPAPLGRRLLARVLDGALLAAVGTATVLPLLPGVLADFQHRIDLARVASRLTGRQEQVWLFDGLVLGRLAIVLGVLLLAGLLLEVLPTARTGRTLGKRVAGLRVVRADGARRPGFGRAVVRWLVGQLSLLTVVGALAVLFDRKRRRGWQDRAAGTTVVAN